MIFVIEHRFVNLLYLNLSKALRTLTKLKEEEEEEEKEEQ